MQFRTLDLALAAQRAIVPLVKKVQRHDRKLAQQLRDATNSFVLNLGEGAYSDSGHPPQSLPELRGQRRRGPRWSPRRHRLGLPA